VARRGYEAAISGKRGSHDNVVVLAEDAPGDTAVFGASGDRCGSRRHAAQSFEPRDGPSRISLEQRPCLFHDELIDAPLGGVPG
jgi:hypothetical protein